MSGSLTKSDMELGDKMLMLLVTRDVLFGLRTSAVCEYYRPDTDRKTH